ncbi:hypothetical protein Afil01_65110 [Actinorhabdospora filicis]|uniref:SMI1/KNR4 family protein n=1 Tax=Actinorhabdospora filicis TaxID=1785913 RepID=A0A9W6SRR3_9ACTN|nr:hypothetical protein [Actinorhabdospora filicis]GLZ81704.1 hypothetical protein Afil01_65110 [Actinorhabdospora filicis]
MSDLVEMGRRAARHLAATGLCEMTPGLTEAEFARVEAEFGFSFAPEHRAFLAEGLPLGEIQAEPGVIVAPRPWPDWRDGDPEDLRRRLDRPVRSIMERVEDGGWDLRFGPFPDDRRSGIAAARAFLAGAPQMVPVFSHRYLPAGADYPAHPVLSMWDTDIICYGTNLDGYIRREFGKPDDDEPWPPHTTIPVWSDLLY